MKFSRGPADAVPAVPLGRRIRPSGELPRDRSCEDDQMSSRLPAVDPDRLAQWCQEQLGSPPAGEIFRSGYLSAVIGLRLADGRAIVVKVRPGSPRIAACTEVQRRLFESGYPCPEPLTGAAPFGDGVATAETYVPGGGSRAGTSAGRGARLTSRAKAPAKAQAERSAAGSEVPPGT
jgi:hypothetical protein